MADLTISVDIDARGTKKGADEVKSAIQSIRQSIAGIDFASLGQKLENAGAMMSQFGDKLRQIGTTLTVAVTAPLVGVATAILKAGGEYEKALNIFQAVTKATGEEMDRAARVAKDLGADLSLPATSAKDAALAMTELGKAGLTASQAMDAAKGVLQLAAAGQLDAARAAEIAANALNAFNLEAKETGRIANLLAAAANASSAEVEDIALAMQQAGSSFATARMPIEDMVTAISALANAGIKGSDAGTSLKTFIQSLAAPSSKAAETMTELGVAVFDASGKMKQMPEIIGQFQTALAGLTDEQQAAALYKIFGSDAIRAAQILFREGTEGFEKLKEQVTAAGAAAELANARMKGLAGAWAGLKSQLETAGIEIYEVVKAPLTEFLRDVSAFVSQATQAFGQLSPEMQKAIIVFTALAAVLGPVLIAIGAVVSAIGTLISAAGAIASAVAAVGGLAAASAIIAVIVAGIAQLGIAAAALYVIWQTNFGGIRDLTQVVADGVKQLWSTMMIELSKLTQEILAEVQKFWAENKDAIMEIVNNLSTAFREVWTALVTFWRENHETIKTVASEIWEGIKIVIVEAVRVLGSVIKLFLSVLNGDWSKAWEATKEILSAATRAWIAIINGATALTVGAVKLLLQAVWNLAGWLFEESGKLGLNIVKGLVNGMITSPNLLVNAARWVGQKVIDTLKDSLRTESPSRATYEIGQFVAEGLANGIESGTPQAAKAANEIGGSIISGLKNIFGGDVGGFINNALGILTDSSRTWGDRLRAIFSSVAENFKKMITDINRSGSMGGSSGSGGGFGSLLSSLFTRADGKFGVPGDKTGTLDSAGNFMVDGRSIFKKFTGEGGFFGSEGFGNNVGTYNAIGGVANIVGGLIGGRVGGFISGAGSGLAMGASIGTMIMPGIGTAIGAVVGAIGGGLLSLIGGDPKRKRDKNEKLPQLTQGFTDSLAQLRQLIQDVRTLRVSPDSALARATELRASIASGFGIQWESKKYRNLAQQQITQRLAEADALIAELRNVADVSRAAGERERRLLPEFAGGVYMSPAFMAFRRRNGMMAGAWTGRDEIPAMIAKREMVLNPFQQSDIKRRAGFDVFAGANIPGYAGGVAMPSSFSPTPAQAFRSEPMNLNVTVVVEQDAAGIWYATAQSDAGQKVIANVVERKYSNDEIKLKRRGA